MILWWQGQLMVSRLNWNGNGQRRWVYFWTDVCWTSGLWRDSGAAILQVSCKNVIYKTETTHNASKSHRNRTELWNKRNNIVNTHTDNNTLAELRNWLCHVRVIKTSFESAHLLSFSHQSVRAISSHRRGDGLLRSLVWWLTFSLLLASSIVNIITGTKKTNCSRLIIEVRPTESPSLLTGVLTFDLN